MSKSYADTATGCHESPSGIGQFYDNDGKEVTHDEAAELFSEGHTVHVPNAGAGSYNEVMEKLGWEEVREIDTGSSAGDWSFALSDGENWYVAYQSNRHPHFGFSYIRNNMAFDSFEDACDFAENC